MKNLIYFSTLLCAIVLIFSCTPCPDCPEGPDFGADATTLTLQDTISKQTYDTWILNWKTYGQSYTVNTLMEYYTMPLIDITEFTQHPGTGPNTVVAARFVLGMEIVSTDTIPHLMLVGVNSAGASLTDASRQQYIYDVTQPCPSSCGANSLL